MARSCSWEVNLPEVKRLLPSINSVKAASGVRLLCARACNGAPSSRPPSKLTAVPVSPSCKNRRLDGTLSEKGVFIDFLRMRLENGSCKYIAFLEAGKVKRRKAIYLQEPF